MALRMTIKFIVNSFAFKLRRAGRSSKREETMVSLLCSSISMNLLFVENEWYRDRDQTHNESPQPNSLDSSTQQEEKRYPLNDTSPWWRTRDLQEWGWHPHSQDTGREQHSSSTFLHSYESIYNRIRIEDPIAVYGGWEGGLSINRLLGGCQLLL